MARDSKQVERLIAELASLTKEERARVLAEVARQEQFHPPPADFKPPTLMGEGRWFASDRREDVYGDDGR